MVIYSDLGTADWQRKETNTLLSYLKVVDSSTWSPFSGGLNHLDTTGNELGGVRLSTVHSFYQEVSPAVSYILYCTSWVASRIFSINPSSPSDSDKHQILILAKLILLLVDSVLLVCCTTAYISQAYSAYRRQLQYCYLGIILLCPAFFFHDYLHLSFSSLGYHILFLIVFSHDHGEYLIAGALSGLLVNFHRSYWLVAPLLIASLAARSMRHRFTTEMGPRRIISVSYDMGQLVVAFAAVYLAVTSPWFMEADDFWGSLEAIVVTPARDAVVS